MTPQLPLTVRLSVARTVPAWIFVAVVAIGAAGITIPYAIWSLADATPPVRELYAPVALDAANQARVNWAAGGWVYIWRYLEVKRPLPCMARRTLANESIVVRLPDIWEPIQFEHTGQEPINTATLQIPTSVVPGYYNYRVELECTINQIKTVKVALRDVQLYVATNPTLEKVGEVEKKVDALNKYVKPAPSTSTIKPKGK